MEEEKESVVRKRLSEYRGEMFRYALGLTANDADARDVVQEASIDLYRRAEEFDSDRPFLAWAYRFIYFEVLTQRRDKMRSPLVFDTDLLELFASEGAENGADDDQLRDGLLHCIEKLPVEDRSLVEARYFSSRSLDELIAQSGKSRRTVFRHLDRIRLLLRECILSKQGIDDTL